MVNQSSGNKRTTRERLRETLNKFKDKLDSVKDRKGIYSYTLDDDGTVTIEPVLPVRKIIIDRDFEYNKHVRFADIVKSMR